MGFNSGFKGLNVFVAYKSAKVEG